MEDMEVCGIQIKQNLQLYSVPLGNLLSRHDNIDQAFYTSSHDKLHQSYQQRKYYGSLKKVCFHIFLFKIERNWRKEGNETTTT